MKRKLTEIFGASKRQEIGLIIGYLSNKSNNGGVSVPIMILQNFIRLYSSVQCESEAVYLKYIAWFFDLEHRGTATIDILTLD